MPQAIKNPPEGGLWEAWLRPNGYGISRVGRERILIGGEGKAGKSRAWMTICKGLRVQQTVTNSAVPLPPPPPFTVGKMA